jgi:hypothetical protein
MDLLLLNICFASIGAVMISVIFITLRAAWLRSTCSKTVIVKLVSASSPNKKLSKAKVYMPPTAHFVADSQQIDPNQYMQLLVDGQSMQNFGINDGDVVLVNQEVPALDADTKPIILLKVYPEHDNKIEYKLRKFIEYKRFQDENDFKEWLNIEHSELGYDHCNVSDKIEKSKKFDTDLVISQTMAKKKKSSKRVPHCSVHLADDIAGTIQYRIPRKKIRVWEKF